MSERIKFLGCLCASAAIHAVFFVSLPHQQANRPLMPRRPLEVSYQQAPSPKKTVPAKTTTRTIEKLPKIETKQSPQILQAKKTMAADIIKTDIFKNRPSLKDDPVSKKMVSLSDIPGETAKTPEYRSYYQIVRERIRRLAYYNYRKLERGEVFLTFSLTSKGELIEAAVNEAKTSPSPYLRDIALKSIEEAAPYPEFPEKLRKNDRLTFNVIISFELK